MSIAQTIPLADGWSMHGGNGWWIAMMVVMVLFWGAIILGAVWLFRGAFDGWQRPRGESPVTKESPVEILERRFAEGAISPEEYRARREILGNGSAQPNGDHEDEPLTAPTAGEGRQ